MFLYLFHFTVSGIGKAESCKKDKSIKTFFQVINLEVKVEKFGHFLSIKKFSARLPTQMCQMATSM
jgi:hypothetical protein